MIYDSAEILALGRLAAPVVLSYTLQMSLTLVQSPSLISYPDLLLNFTPCFIPCLTPLFPRYPCFASATVAPQLVRQSFSPKCRYSTQVSDLFSLPLSSLILLPRCDQIWEVQPWGICSAVSLDSRLDWECRRRWTRCPLRPTGKTPSHRWWESSSSGAWPSCLFYASP